MFTERSIGNGWNQIIRTLTDPNIALLSECFSCLWQTKWTRNFLLFFLQNMANVISYLIVVNGWLLITSIKICKMLLVDILAVYVFQMLSFGIPGWRDQRHSRRIWSGSRNRATQFQNHQILALHMLPFWKSCLRRTPRHLSAISIMCTLHILQEAEWLEKRWDPSYEKMTNVWHDLKTLFWHT